MKQKKYEAYLYSFVGVAVMFLIVVFVNVIADWIKFRRDLTEHRIYTLAEGTKRILKEVEGPVEVRLYASTGGARMPSNWRNYARMVEDMLSEFAEVSGGAIVVKKFDPQPDTDEEDLANLDGVQAQIQRNGDSFYLGVAVSQDPVKVALPVLPPNQQELLEYDLIRAISRVTQTEKPVVGVLTPLPIFGRQIPPQLAMQTGQQSQPPWIFLSELQRDFEVRQIPMDADQIEEDVDVIMLVHPKEISEVTQFALDQFVLRGGKMLALLDAKSLLDQPQDGNPMSAMMGGGSSNLDTLLKAWGLTFDTAQVVADRKYSRELQRGAGQPARPEPAWLFIDKDGIDADDAVTSQLDDLLMVLAGHFTGTPVEGLEKTVLFHSSADSQLVEPMNAMFSGQKILDEFKASDTQYDLAVRLRGKFKTAFPDGKPKAEDAGADAEAKEPIPTALDDGTLKESTQESAVVLIGDSDFVYDNFCVQRIQIFNVAQPINGNLALVQNLVEQLAGDVNLIGARSRATLSRPFTVVRELQAQARDRYQGEINKLEQERQDAAQRLGELQTQKQEGQRFILSPEQQAEIQNLQKTEAETSRRLRQVRKDLAKEINSLQNRLKWLNIAGMPVVVTIAGLALAFVRKQRTRAK